MKKWLIFLLCVPVLMVSCDRKGSRKIKVPRDTTITPSTAFTTLSLDSAQVAEYIEIVLEPGQVYEAGDRTQVIQQVKKKLFLTGDFASADSSFLFTSALTQAVQRYQYRMGIKQDGHIGKDVISQLNVPIKKRIEQLLLNMERMRWKLHVFEVGEVVIKMYVVVGKTGSQTVIFSDALKHVVFSPYWNVPRSIVRSEIYPAMQRNDNYLAQKNMEQIGFGNGLPIIRQKPGKSNALGLVKFIFPNS